MKIGERVRGRKDNRIGTVTARKERGVAGCSSAYFEWIEVTYDDGTTAKYSPSSLEVVDEP